MTTKTLPLHSNFKSRTSLFFLSLIILLLSGCDNSGKDSKNSFDFKPQTKKYTEEMTLQGKVSNAKGSLRSGTIKVTDTKGSVITTTQLENNDHYSVTVPTGTELPVILTYFPAAGSKSKEKLVSVTISPTTTTIGINEQTTFIAKKAKALGGYSYANMVSAAEMSINVPSSNKTTSGFRGDPTKQYGGWH